MKPSETSLPAEAPEPPVEITRWLRLWQHDPEARERVLELVYTHLRRLARWRLRNRGADTTLQATELVHETYLRLASQNRMEWQSRNHFFAIAAQAMRRVVLDHTRRHRANRRIAPRRKVPLDEAPELAVQPRIDLLALDQALDRLATVDRRQARLVELRFFAGLSIHDTAVVLGSSPATVKRDWQLAQAWLRREMAR